MISTLIDQEGSAAMSDEPRPPQSSLFNANADGPEGGSPPPASEDTRKKILYVEDDPEIAALLAEDLTERGYSVRVAPDAQSGLWEILRDKPDMVLCDIHIPGPNGFELFKQLRSIGPQFDDVRFVLLTAQADRRTELEGRNMGADDYVTKPIDFEMLAEVIKARLGRVARTLVWSQGVKLNAREVETLTLAARGKTSTQIAELIGLSKRTVDFHLDNARVKLGSATRIEAAIKATMGLLIDP